MIVLLGFLLVMSVNAATDIHACILSQQTGSFHRSNLMNGKTLYNKLLAAQNNIIGDYPVNITWHHIDGESKRTRIYELARQLYYGNWSIQGLTNEAAPHPCDVIFFARTSSLLPSLLSGLKDYNLRVPVYPYAINGIKAFMNLSLTPHVPLWDNVVVAETMCDKELVGVMDWLHIEKVKTVFFIHEANAGAYIDSLVDSIRADAAKFGWELVLDKEFHWEPCITQKCAVKQRKRLDGLLSSHVIKKSIEYTADVFITLRNTVKDYECLDEMTYFHDNMINFKAYVMVGCVSRASKNKLIAENNMHHFIIGAVGWDSTFKGEDYDEQFSSVGLFRAAGIHSPAKFAERWKKEFNEAADHISAAAPLTAFYYFHRDFIKARGNVSNIIKNFDNSRTPESSFYGLMASDSTGTNAFQMWMPVQIMNDDTLKVINLDGKGVYPAPQWQYRHCYDNCVPCPKCKAVEEATVLVYFLCILPFLVLIAIMMIHNKRQKFNLTAKILTVASLMSLTVKNVSCALAIIIVWLEYDVGLTEDLGGAISMVIFTGFALCFMFVTYKTKLGVMWYFYKLEVKNSTLPDNKQESGSKALYSMKLIESTSEFIIPILTDLPIAIIQVEAVIIRKTYSPTLISSLILLVFSIGGALKNSAVSSLLCQCLEYENIPIIGRFTNRMKLECAFNPCFSSTQMLRGVLKQLMRADDDDSDIKDKNFNELDEALSVINKRESRLYPDMKPEKSEKQKSL